MQNSEFKAIQRTKKNGLAYALNKLEGFQSRFRGFDDPILGLFNQLTAFNDLKWIRKPSEAFLSR